MSSGRFNTVNKGMIVVLLGLGVVTLSVVRVDAKGKPRRDNQGTTTTTAAPDKADTTNADKSNEYSKKGFRHSGNHMDECFATKVIHANQNEIRASQIAQERSSSAPVKQFAQMMVQQHQEFLTKLQPFSKAGQAMTHSKDRTKQTVGYRAKEQDDANNRNNKTVNDDANKNQGTKTQIQQPGGTTDVTVTKNNDNNSVAAFHHQLGQIEQELAQQCRQSMEKELASKSGADFDKCYVGMQIAAHMHMLDTLTVFERHASPELKTVLDEGLKTTQTHLDHAKTLMETLAKNPQNSTAAPGNAGSK